MSKRRHPKPPPRNNGLKLVKSPAWLAPVGAALQMGLMKVDPLARPRVREGVTIEDPVPVGAAPWEGVVVGHWVCGPVTTHHPDKMPKPVYVCISKCGVVGKFSQGDLAKGGTKTCHACRPSDHAPPACRVLPESELGDLQRFWELSVAVVFENTSAVKGREAGVDFDTLARPLVTAVVAATPYGKEFGWKLWVKDCHKKPVKRDRSAIAVHLPKGDGFARCVSMTLYPGGSQFCYDVDLSTGRTDVPFVEVGRAVCDAVAPYLLTNGVAAAATPGPIDIEKLMGLRNNLDTLLKVGNDVNELAGLKAAAKVKVEQARTTERAANLALLEAEEAAKVAADKKGVLQDLVNDYDRRLRNTIADRDKADVVLITAEKKRADAQAVYGPAAEVLKAEVAGLKELETMEAEQLKAVGNAAGMKALLAALAGISGQG